MFASARDWARFGLLYLDDCVVGRVRILPEGWVSLTTSPTLDTGYGAGFWLNVVRTPMQRWVLAWGMPGALPDAFFALGYPGAVRRRPFGEARDRTFRHNAPR
jgi:CubicO group peptidase (beta-lactamase class C family)